MTARPILSLFLLSLLSPPLHAPARAQTAPTCGMDCPNVPIEPFRIIGNIYWIGMSDHGSLLFTTPQGHIIMDTGAEEHSETIRGNVEKLGFRLRDVKYIVSTHGHADHVGGFAVMREATGAKVLVAAGDAPMIRDGGKSDFRSQTEPFRPATVDETFNDGYQLKLGGTVLTARLTPGHTRGCTTWTTTVEDEGRKLEVAIVCQVAIAGDRAPLVNNSKYPQIAEDFEKAFRVLKSLQPDVFLALRSTTFHREDKLRRLQAGEKPNPFIDRGRMSAYVEEYEKRFRDQLEEDRRKYQ